MWVSGVRLKTRLIFAVSTLLGCLRPASERLWPTPAWGSPAAIVMRASGPDRFLIRSGELGAYSVDVGGAGAAPTLMPAAAGSWEALTSAIVECERQRLPRDLRYASPPQWSFAGVALTTTGAHALNATAPSDSAAFALLSASGVHSSLMPFLGQGAKAPFFLDFFVIEGAKASHRGSVRLPFTDEVSAVTACWSPDQKLVVVADLMRTAVVLVRAPSFEARQFEVKHERG